MKNNTVYTKATDISGMAKKQFNFRFDEKLIEQVEMLADKDNRTLTNYIENLLAIKVDEGKVKKANEGSVRKK